MPVGRVIRGAIALVGWLALAALLVVAYAGYLFFAPLQTDIAWVQPGEPEAAFPGSEGLQQVLDGFSAEHGGVGLQASIILPDGRAWTGVAGNAHHGHGYPMTPAHHLYVGSVTKIYTATLVMELVAQDLISLDAPITRWVDLPQAGRVTVRMLLNHTSGIPSYTEDGWFLFRYFGQPRKHWQPGELVDVVRGRPLTFEPGSRHEYSNTNYVLLGMILEQVTGRPFALLVRELAGKLGLEDTYALTYPDELPVATGYDESLFRLGRRNVARFRTSVETGAYSAGAVRATSQDVARFLHGLITGQLLAQPVVEEMQAFMDAPDEDVPAQRGYGLGLRQLVVHGEPFVGHTGTIPGYSGFAMHSTERAYTLAVLSNLSVIDQMGLLERMQEAVAPLAAPVARPPDGTGRPRPAG